MEDWLTMTQMTTTEDHVLMIINGQDENFEIVDEKERFHAGGMHEDSEIEVEIVIRDTRFNTFWRTSYRVEAGEIDTTDSEYWDRVYAKEKVITVYE